MNEIDIKNAANRDEINKDVRRQINDIEKKRMEDRQVDLTFKKKLEEMEKQRLSKILEGQNIQHRGGECRTQLLESHFRKHCIVHKDCTPSPLHCTCHQPSRESNTRCRRETRSN